MQTISTEYKGADALEEFIREKGIKKESKLLVQVFCGKVNQFNVCGIVDDILNVLPNADIIGVTSYGELNHYKRNLTQSSIISISEFKKTKVETHFISNHKKTHMNAR